MGTYEGIGMESFEFGKMALVFVPLIFFFFATRRNTDSNPNGCYWNIGMGVLMFAVIGGLILLGVSDQQLVLWLPAVLILPLLVVTVANREMKWKAKLGCLGFAAIALLPVIAGGALLMRGRFATLKLAADNAYWESKGSTAVVARKNLSFSEEKVGSSKTVWDVRSGNDHFAISSRMLFRAPDGKTIRAIELVQRIRDWSNGSGSE